MTRIQPALVLAAALVPALAYPQTPASPAAGPPLVVTAGQAVVKRTPDRAWVTIGAESRARTPQDAQKQNAAAMTAVIDRIKAFGIPAEAIQTVGYDLQPEFDYVNGKQTLRGYVARNSVEVRVDNLTRVGEVIDSAVESGATGVRGVRFDLKDRAVAEREAIKYAVADARERAMAIATGAGLTFDRIVRIEEQRAQVIEPRPMMSMRAEMAQDSVTPVAPGELEIRASVTMTAAMK